LLFYTPSGNILLNGTVNATVEGGTKAATRGTAFYYTGGGTLGTISSYTQLNPTNVATWARNSFGNGTTSTLGNLNLTMNQGSRLFLTEKVNMDLSNTSATNLFSGLTPSERPNITGLGSGYRTFMLYHSHLNVDQAVDLDNANDEYNLMEISSSSITNNNTITGTKTGQIAMAQENDTTLKSAVTLTNNGTINLSGANSAGVYAKNAIINNVNAITVGNSSSGIYGLNNTEISNTGSITTGGSSTGIYYSDVEKDNAGNITTVNNTTTGLKNDGTITLNGDDSVGLTYEPGNITGAVTFENSSTGSITSTGDKNVGMFAKVAQNG
ncbi:autotransporter domain-containing protein, partial [Fusobacterium animalis]